MDNVILNLRSLSAFYDAEKNPLFQFSEPNLDVPLLTQAEMQEYLLQRQVFDGIAADEAVSFASFSRS
uniref:hypothetical protein n=1 Tax=Alcaligenes faecalis TaxID=511 RepID=UPI003D0902F8